ncbi:signal transduction histidine kinase [Cytobacillus eiseniae]|uniref:histidine kinase n=1 Tax=Cytobacillus eiseniae TaxID=762947 RepID=A0ABS4RAI1_9BACI|nr:ATP-binding protein [Cytobacillus eiseniae]MBP2239890.1 signal transduction histidine kinase [Cytobacillus eiseniae]
MMDQSILKNTISFSDEHADLAHHSHTLENIHTLAAEVAHEIKNPLTSVKGFLQLLRPYLIEIGKEQYADIALDELNRAQTLIFDFLNAANPQRNKKKLVPLNKIINDIRLFYGDEASHQDILLNITLLESNPSIFADEMQIKQVLINLLKNAIDAINMKSIKTSGQIDLELAIEDQAIAIIFKDNGCGMSDETINNIFVPFYTTKQTGTGIGLPICKKIIEDHSGQIMIASLLGIGSTIKIHLPLY